MNPFAEYFPVRSTKSRDDMQILSPNKPTTATTTTTTAAAATTTAVLMPLSLPSYTSIRLSLRPTTVPP